MYRVNCNYTQGMHNVTHCLVAEEPEMDLLAVISDGNKTECRTRLPILKHC